MQALIRPLAELAEFEAVRKNKKQGMIQITDCVDSQKTHLMYALSNDSKYRIIVCSDNTKAKHVYEEYRFLDNNIYYYPAKDMLFYQADLRGKLLLKGRMEVIKAMLELEGNDGITIVTSFDGFMDSLPPLLFMQEQIMELRAGDTVEFQELQKRMSEMGYHREVQVDAPGQFAIRGGIMDIFPLTEEMPIRIELWDDEIDSIRSFDLDSQRSVEDLDNVVVYPATEFPKEENRVSFLEYFDKKESILFLDDPIRLIERGEEVEREFTQAKEHRENSEFDTEYEEIELTPAKDIIRKMNQFHSVGFTVLESKCGDFKVQETISFWTKSVNPYNNSFDMLTKDLKQLKRTGYRTVMLSGSRTRAKRLAEDLRDYDLSSYYSEDMEREVQPGEIMVAHGYVEQGYEYPMLKFIVIAESDIFGKTHKRKKRKTVYEGQKIQSFSDLKVGDYVVHENHGIGIYEGIEKIEIDHVIKDYMKISYAGNSNLYILATQFDQIQKYASSDAKKPQLNKLGTQKWNNTKQRVRGAVQEIAKELVELYAVRQAKEGYVYGTDTVWQKEFEEMFPFEETEDQLLAIEATKRDMESTKIMDRLICGDVGYGKTEIAIRAAFKAVQENKQVAYLVPTTILAQQHYNTFVQRMKDFPIRIELLCRFRTPSQQKKAIADMKKGLVDIVIGTHRLLSQDIEFKNLGLLVVDEEQRFGVKHKERIKELKSDVDVMTLTATPIPRTLHMSLIGIRDMSVLEEAPHDRMPIQTYVMEYDDEMVREAIQRELARQGQVYYVYNRIKDIAEITARIQEMVPEANVAYAHGQMTERALEQIMYQFINGEVDVLVSTTIIETGLDISNVNTMIIHDADKMGLSQLYQLRGRIGRSNRLAYAFLLYKRDVMLKEVAEKRLSAIREFTDLGSGFKIAMRDLEIRGAGNLLGEAQHGHMEAVGYDLYCKMLNEAVKHLKGETEEETYVTTIDLNVDAYIPPSYIPNEFQKLDIYKRIASIETEEEMEDITDELIDRFGNLPKKVQQLVHIAALKALAHSAYMIAVEQKGDELRFTMYERARVDVMQISDLVKKHNGNLKFYKGDKNPYFVYMKKGRNLKEKDESVLELVKNVINDIKGLIE